MNLRKITALVMILALVLAPSLSLGESAAAAFEQKALEAGRSLNTTVTYEASALFAQDPSLSIIADVLNSLSLKTTEQEDGEDSLGSFAMLLQGQPVLTLTAMNKDDEFHLMSSLLGESVLSFTQQEFAQLLMTLVDAAVSAAEQSEVPEEVLSGLKDMLNGLNSLLTGDMSGDDTDVPSVPLKLPEFDQESLQADLILPVMAWIADITSAPEVTTGTFESEKHDTATTQEIYSISTEKIYRLLQTVSIWATKEKNINAIYDFLASSGVDLDSGEDTKAAMLQWFKDLPASFVNDIAFLMRQPITVTLLKDDEGNTPAIEIKAQLAGAEGKEPFTLVGIYSKTEGADVISLFTLDTGTAADTFRMSFSTKAPADDSEAAASAWKFETSMTEMGKEAFALALDFTSENKVTETQADEAWRFNVDLNVSGMPISASMDFKSTSAFDGKDVKADKTLAFYMTGMEGPVLTIKAATESGDPIAYPEVPADSVRLGKMTAEELEAWGESAIQTALTSLMSALPYLPQSVLTLISGAASSIN